MTQLDHPRRPYLIYALLCTLALAVLARAWYLQVTVAEDNLERAGWKTESTIHVQTPRGGIRDRHGVPLAESVEAYNIAIDPRAFYAQKKGMEHEIVALLSEFKDFDSDAFLAMANLPQDDIPRFMRIVRDASPHQAIAIKKAARDLGTNAIIVRQTYQRFYPMHTVAGAIVGFVDRDGVEGRSGLERGLDASLKGGELVYTVQRDARRDPYLLGELPNEDVVRGVTVTLTLDTRLQRSVEKILAKAVEKYQAQEAMAVVSNVKTGELLAIATVPTIDPNTPFETDEKFLWSSHALSYAYEPGSTAKVLTYAFALNDGVIQPDTIIDCEDGVMEVDDRKIRDTHPEKLIPAWKVLQVSSNIGAWKMAAKMGAAKHHQGLASVGIGSPVELPMKGSTRGILPDVPWIDIRHANIAFGHGFSLSIMQLHLALSAIYNHGLRLKPRLIHSLSYGDGRVERSETKAIGQVLRPEVAAQVLRAMKTVVHDEDGTGHAARIDGVNVAGKTGTARLVDLDHGGYLHEYLGSFSGTFPAEDPRYAITVWIVRPNKEIAYYGSAVAAPVFKQIGQEVIGLYGLGADKWAKNLDDAYEKIDVPAPQEPPQESDADDARITGVVPHMVGQRASVALQWLQDRKLPVELYGTGVVAAQVPEAGERLQSGRKVVLQLAPEDTP